MIERVDIQTVTATEVVLSYTLAKAARVRVTAHNELRDVAVETVESEVVGRVLLKDLLPDTRYEIRLAVHGQEFDVTTLHTTPTPHGPLHWAFAVVADPHITTNPEMRNGRLFPESAVILREIVRQLNKEALDFVLIPGDLTDMGAVEELWLADEILSDLNCPVMIVPGDHERLTLPDSYESRFGPGRWSIRRDGLHIIGCDTSAKHLGKEGINHLRCELESESCRKIIISHLQLVPDEYIVDEDRVIEDWRDFEREVVPAVPEDTLAYVGHKNVPSHVSIGNLLQINTPQPLQYPCGYMIVRCYDNGIYHHVRPIFSEILNDVSRRLGNALDNPRWEESYRRGKSHDLWNFVFAGTLKAASGR